MNLREKFMHYVMLDTQSLAECDITPSTSGQRVLAETLYQQLNEMGVKDVLLDEKGYLYGSLASNIDVAVPTVGFIAHLDTSNAYPSPKVFPRVITNYDRGSIVLDAGQILNPETDYNLKNSIGCDLVVTDGRSLLGGDDKSGIAVIMEMVDYLMQHQEVKHGKIAFAFTPDEENGKSQDHFDVDAFGADYAYTVDGAAFGDIEYENFNGATAFIVIEGIETHPGEAKNKMRNAMEIAMTFHQLFPAHEKPEYTEGYEGFYHLMRMEGDCRSCRLVYLIRDHDADNFNYRKKWIYDCANLINRRYGDGTVSVEIKNSYKNMSEVIEPHMFLIEYAKEEIKALGFQPNTPAIRGGTDGVRLSFMGVPCPNLGTGTWNHHAVTEIANLTHMEYNVELLLRLIQRFVK